MKFFFVYPLIAISSFSIVFGQTTQIPDSVFEQALISANIDKNGFNGNIQNSDAAPITLLTLDTLGISNLAGIEAFVNLEWLLAGGNSLSSVDLSSNTQLKNLNLSFNQLGGIDLSQNNQLTHINLEGNAIPSIDVSNLDSLDDLDIGGNLLTSLDVSNNPLLTSLEIWNIFSHTNRNQITSIDLSNNPLLFRFLAIDNQLDSLDVSQNPELFTLNCSDNFISQLDLSNNLKLFTVSCSNNQLTKLDVAHLDLGGLNCRDNQIDFLDLAASSDLVLLNCSNNEIDSILLPPTPYILDLYVHDNNLTSLDVSHLGIIEELICQNNKLQTLNMRNGTNTFIQGFNALNNPELACIKVDDVTYANATFINSVDPGVLFSEDCSSVGLDDIYAGESISLFPNPANDLLFSMLQSPVEEILIFNAFGEIVHRESDFPVSLSSLVQGVYVIRVMAKEKDYITKFIKSN